VNGSAFLAGADKTAAALVSGASWDGDVDSPAGSRRVCDNAEGIPSLRVL
jgi:hypothetical protein